MKYGSINKAWNRPTENRIAAAERYEMNDRDYLERFAHQAENYAAENPNLISVFIDTGSRDTILEAKNKELRAKSVAKNHPELHLDEIGLDEPHEQALFLMALAEETSKVEYNQ